MERLQAALEKARASRGTAAPRPTEGRGTGRRSSAAAPQDWAGIELAELAPQRLLQRRIVAARGGPEATPFDLLRTKMLQQMRAHKWKRVAITSPGGACGKTTIAANLATSLARQKEVAVVLMDLDLRRPSMARMFGIRGEHSCWQVLNGEVPFRDQAVRISENVVLSLNHAPARDPAELLSSKRTSEAIDEIDATYRPDVMLFDMPPMLATDDNLAFMRNVDCALLVAGAESTTSDQVDVCERDLAEQTNMMGVVLNKCRYMGPDHDYSYY